MAIPRTAEDKLKPSMDFNKDAQKVRMPKTGDLWKNRRGQVFRVVLTTNHTQIENTSSCFPINVVYERVGNTVPNQYASRHLAAWSVVMTYIGVEEA